MNWYLYKISNQISKAVKSRGLSNKYKEFKKNFNLPNPVKKWKDHQKDIFTYWAFWRINLGENINFDGIDILGSPKHKSKLLDNFKNPNYSYQNLIKENNEYHESLQTSEENVESRKYNNTYSPKDVLIYNEKGEPDRNGGFAWAKLGTGYCEAYGKSMGHCGNAGYREGDDIFTFYDKTTNIHYLTFIVNNGALGESKAFNNSRPPTDNLRIIGRPDDINSFPIQKAYFDFLYKYVNSIKGTGYKPFNNFQLEQLPKEWQNKLKKEKPYIDDYAKYATGGKKNWISENGNLFISPDMSNEELINLEHWNIPALAAEYLKRGINNSGLLEIIIRSPNESLKYAELLGYKNIPNNIIETIAMEPESSYKYAENINPENVPDIILKSIAKDYYTSWLYAKNINPKKVSPVIINSIANDYITSYEYASLLKFQNVPLAIIQSIAEDPYYSFSYAKSLRFKNIPPIILGSIAKNSSSNFFNIIRELKAEGDDLPLIILQSIAKNSVYSYNYAHALQRINVPQIILDSIAKSPIYSFYYARDIIFKNVPPQIEKSAKQYMLKANKKYPSS